MKKLLLACFLLTGVSLTVSAQEAFEKVAEKRAREMHRVMGLNDPEQWKKFVKENYTKAMIDRPMKTSIKPPGGSAITTTESPASDNIANKAMAFQRLHDDFGDGKITALKTEGNQVDMSIASSDGRTGNFTLTFDKNEPYLIDAMRVMFR